MTVEAENKIDQEDQEIPVSMKAVAPVRMEAADVEQESSGSSTEDVEESPRSVAKFRRYVHNQVLRVKEEELLLLREDVDGQGSCLNMNNIKGRKKSDSCFQERHVNFLIFARTATILPCSPLSGKTDRATGVRAASL